MTTATQITKPEMTDMVKRYVELREKFAATISEISGSRMLNFSSYLQPRYDRTTTDELELANAWIAEKAELAAEAAKLAKELEFMISIKCDKALAEYNTALHAYYETNNSAKAAN